jgi:hypothetical protein
MRRFESLPLLPPLQNMAELDEDAAAMSGKQMPVTKTLSRIIFLGSLPILHVHL